MRIYFLTNDNPTCSEKKVHVDCFTWTTSTAGRCEPEHTPCACTPLSCN